MDKKLKDLDYPELITEATSRMVNNLQTGLSLRNCNQAVIDLTIAWLQAKGKVQ